MQQGTATDALSALQVIWTVLVESIPTVGKNTQQVRAAIQKQVKAYEKLLKAFCSSARVEASLIVHVQVRAAELSSSLDIPRVRCLAVPHGGLVSPQCYDRKTWDGMSC